MTFYVIRTLFLAAAMVLIALVTLPSTVIAQEGEPQAKRYENVDWHRIVLVDFTAGGRERQLEIIENYLVPASEKAGTQPPVVIEMQSGPWDVMLVWTMKEGPSEMTWERHPENIKSRKALVEIAGSMEEATKVWEEHMSLVARSTSFIGLSGRHGMPIVQR